MRCRGTCLADAGRWNRRRVTACRAGLSRIAVVSAGLLARVTCVFSEGACLPGRGRSGPGYLGSCTGLRNSPGRARWWAGAGGISAVSGGVGRVGLALLGLGAGPQDRGGAAGARDAHLTLQARQTTAQDAERPSDLLVLRQHGIARVSDDAPRGVCRHPGTGREGILTCGSARAHYVRCGRYGRYLDAEMTLI